MNPLSFFLTFLKASLFSTGGLGNLPSLHQDLIGSNWATEADFGQAIAIGQVTPGPNGLWVIALGYLIYGLPGALLALLAIILPPLLVLALAAVYRKIEHRREVRGVLRGLALAIIGSVLVTAWLLVTAPGIDWRGWILAAASFGLTAFTRLHVFFVLALAGVAGLLFF